MLTRQTDCSNWYVPTNPGIKYLGILYIYIYTRTHACRYLHIKTLSSLTLPLSVSHIKIWHMSMSIAGISSRLHTWARCTHVWANTYRQVSTGMTHVPIYAHAITHMRLLSILQPAQPLQQWNLHTNKQIKNFLYLAICICADMRIDACN